MTDFEEKALHVFYQYQQLDRHRYCTNNICRLTHAHPDEDTIVTEPGFPGGWGAPTFYLADVLPKTASKLKKLDREVVPLKLEYLLLSMAFHMNIECKSKMNILPNSSIP